MPRRKRNFHLPLEPDLYRRLADEARREGQPATAVAREAIARYLSERERVALDAELREYAEAAAGSGDDLDPLLAEASAELIGADDDETR